ncbi:MAG: adenosine deaminase [Flavobacteriaceae bacterium]|nr:adenosine deaminase [Flavobacteriaceae bacterium]|tara:strand:+ start:4714 stop:5688 length:975 start_codon:yes stop_codon:yes gene_type:complete
MNFSKYHKVELHVHLDCSLSYDVVKKINPKITRSRYINEFIGSRCNSLNDYIKCADRAVEIMQTKEELELVTIDLFEQLKKDNVVYAEIRFAPLLHTKKGLSSAQVVKIISSITKITSKKTGIEASLILCTLRHFSSNQSMETVELVHDFKGTNVVGFDIAADEAGYPLKNHIEAFEFANRKNIFCTAHAGEALGSESILETIDKLMPTRIGHGVRSIEDPSLLERIKEKEIHLEVCYTSNIVTKVYNNYSDHPINQLYKKNISISINSDGRTISDTNLNKEYSLLSKQFKWEKENFINCNINAIKASFASNKIKNKILNLLNS